MVFRVLCWINGLDDVCVFGGWIEWDDPVCGSCGPVIHYALLCFVSVNAL